MKRLAWMVIVACTPRATPTPAPTPVESGAAAGTIHWIGRFERGGEGARFSYPGSMIVARFTGESVVADLETSGQDFFTVVVDDGQPRAIHPSAGRSKQTLVRGLPGGTHTITFSKATESFVGIAKLYGLDVPGGALVPSPYPFAHRIEIIGDSIACGYGILGANGACPFTPDTQSEWHAWGAVAARALGAAHTTIAYSGKGLLRNSSGDTMNAMPVLWERTLADSPDPKWDFSAYSPEVVAINLGTNDFAHGDPGPGFGDAYLDLMKNIRKRHPDAAIVCTLGPMMTPIEIAQARPYVSKAIERMSDARITFLEFAQATKDEGLGCNEHPSAKTQERMGQVLAAHVKERMKW